MARVLVPLAAGCEELEAVTVIDLLRRARIEVVTAGLELGPVKASRGTVLVPDLDLEALKQDYDMVVLPGGQPGSTNLEKDARVLALLGTMAAAGRYTAAICAAPKVLAVAGLLDGKRADQLPGVGRPGGVSVDPARQPGSGRDGQEVQVVAADDPAGVVLYNRLGGVQ